MTRAPPGSGIRTSDPLGSSVVMDTCKGFQLEWREAVGLRLVNWPGRSQTVQRGKKLFFLDGAHTEQSMWACRKWFLSLLDKYPASSEKDNTKRILLFNSTGDRNAEILLTPLISLPFDQVIFCTNETKKIDLAADNTNLNFSFDYAMKKCHINQVTWDDMKKNSSNRLGSHDRGDIKNTSTHVVPHIEDALNLIDANAGFGTKIQIFVTGSLHLVGGVLSFIHPDCYEKNPEDLKNDLHIMDKYSKLGE